MDIKSKIKIIAFDADDTLWVNEPYYRETEKAFVLLLQDYLPAEKVSKLLLEIESKNIKLYGYGVKGFVLSMIETVLKIKEESTSIYGNSTTSKKPISKIITQILDLGKALINMPLVLLPDVRETLKIIKTQELKLVLATKGDLLDQERKLKKSGLAQCFHHIEIMSNKNESDYQKLLDRLEILPDEFLMVGNSIKSDILPVLSVGSYAIHIPYHTTWEHERVANTEQDHERFFKLETIQDLSPIIKKNQISFSKKKQ